MTSLSFTWADLRPLTETPRSGGVLRSMPADFQVDEVPLYLPSGTGEHLYLHVRKTGHTTAHLMRELSAQLGLRPGDVAAAGLKDRHAVTTQWLSLPAKAERRLSGFALEGVELLEVSRHENRLGMGHLKGNRFTVRVREAAGTAALAQTTLDELTRLGIPNYFGPQRFGLGGLNAEEGLRVLRGESRLRDPAVRRFLVSSVQSLIFNRFLALRLERGLFAALLAGDMAKKHDTGGVFEVQDAALESLRAQRGEVSATGTLFGRKVRPLTQEAGTLEQEALAAFELTPAAFSSRKGDRRIIRIFAQDALLEAMPDGYTVSFTLPRGSFATSLLRELTGTDVDGPQAADLQEPLAGDDLSPEET
ncbi:tRNA pseudouridine(13) synthase TruD [Deinococcus sp.]|uniref:tRNA pseudouridine(13) synthase TruD n=1 Tax=Deinococcus sp. TaxID=47478 RepID=UPI003CC50D55